MSKWVTLYIARIFPQYIWQTTGRGLLGSKRALAAVWFSSCFPAAIKFSSDCCRCAAAAAQHPTRNITFNAPSLRINFICRVLLLAIIHSEKIIAHYLFEPPRPRLVQRPLHSSIEIPIRIPRKKGENPLTQNYTRKLNHRPRCVLRREQTADGVLWRVNMRSDLRH